MAMAVAVKAVAETRAKGQKTMVPMAKTLMAKTLKTLAILKTMEFMVEGERSSRKVGDSGRDRQGTQNVLLLIKIDIVVVVADMAKVVVEAPTETVGEVIRVASVVAPLYDPFGLVGRASVTPGHLIMDVPACEVNIEDPDHAPVEKAIVTVDLTVKMNIINQTTVGDIANQVWVLSSTSPRI